MLTYDIKNHCVKKPKKDISLIETDFGFWYDGNGAKAESGREERFGGIPFT